MAEFLLNPVVGVFRQCHECGTYKNITAFPKSNRDHGHKCSACSKRQLVGSVGRASSTRTLRITQAGRSALREWEREQQSA